jgi:segregation and condensation protein B
MPDEDGEQEEPDMAGDDGPDEGRDVDDRLVVEGLLFSAGKPLRMVDIEEATNLPRRQVRSALRKLASDYRRRRTALEVVKVGDRWTMQVSSEYTKPVRAVAAAEVPSRLLRTLALIAYHQPVLQADLQEMLGPKVYDHVRELVGLGLINAARKGSTKELTTTRKFPEYFGIASAKRDEIRRFLAERVGLPPPVPRPIVAEDASEDGPEAEGEAVDLEGDDDGGATQGAAGVDDGPPRRDEPPVPGDD